MTPENTSAPRISLEALEVVARDKTSVPDVADILAETHRNGDEWWKSCALAAVEAMAATGRPFTCYEAARAAGLPDPDHANRWGALMRRARAAGIVVPVATIRGTRPSTHRALVRLWIGAEHVGVGDGR